MTFKTCYGCGAEFRGRRVPAYVVKTDDDSYSYSPRDIRFCKPCTERLDDALTAGRAQVVQARREQTSKANGLGVVQAGILPANRWATYVDPLDVLDEVSDRGTVREASLS